MSENPDKRGRPRCFCEEAALDAATDVFLQKGFEGTSLDDLTQALGINRPSLYAAFGNKEDLFIKVLERYHQAALDSFSEIIAQGRPAKESVAAILNRVAENLRKQCHPFGCLVVNSTTLCHDRYPKIARCLKRFHDRNEVLLRDALQVAIDRGELPNTADAAALSQFYNAVLQGMAVLRRGSQDTAALTNVVELALRAWPAVE